MSTARIVACCVGALVLLCSGAPAQSPLITSEREEHTAALQFVGALPLERFPELQRLSENGIPSEAFVVFEHRSCDGLLSAKECLDAVACWVELLGIRPLGSVSVSDQNMSAFQRTDLYCPARNLGEGSVILVSSERLGCLHYRGFLLARVGDQWEVRFPLEARGAVRFPACRSCDLAGFLRQEGRVWAAAFSLDDGANVVVMELDGKVAYEDQLALPPIVAAQGDETVLYVVSEDWVTSSDRQIVEWDSRPQRWDELSKDYTALALRRIDHQGNHILSSVVFPKPPSEREPLPDEAVALLREAENLFKTLQKEGKVISE